VGIADWRKVARDCMIEEERVLTRLTDMAKALPDEISAAREQAVTGGLSKSIIAPLAQRLIGHVGERLEMLHGRRRQIRQSRPGNPPAC
jgi:hypothetical protein